MAQYVRINVQDYYDIQHYSQKENFWRLRFYLLGSVKIFTIIVALFFLLNFSWMKLLLSLITVITLSCIEYLLYKKATTYRKALITLIEKQFNLAFKSSEALFDVTANLKFLHSDNSCLLLNLKPDDTLVSKRKILSVITPTIDRISYAINKQLIVNLNY